MEQQQKRETDKVAIQLHKAVQCLEKAKQLNRSEKATSERLLDSCRSIIHGHFPGFRKTLDKLVTDEDARAKLRAGGFL